MAAMVLQFCWSHQGKDGREPGQKDSYQMHTVRSPTIKHCIPGANGGGPQEKHTNKKVLLVGFLSVHSNAKAIVVYLFYGTGNKNS